MKRQFFGSLIAVMMLSLAGCGHNPSSSPAEKYKQISGVVVKVEYIAQGSSFNAPDIKKTIITFEDGRVKAFNDISNEVIQKGKTNTFFYNEEDMIVSVEIK